MRTRFFAATGPADRLRERADVRGWRSPPRGWTIVVDSNCLLVLAREGETAIAFANGAVLGTLLDRTTMLPVKDGLQLNPAIVERQGRDLVEHHWGAWFAIVAEGVGHWALRDPSPFAPAYYRTEDGLSFYYSDLETALALDPAEAEVDYDFVRHWLAFPYLRLSRTGLVGMRELLPGTRRQVAQKGETLTMVWDPWMFASEARRIDDFEQAAEQVRREALRVIPAQAKNHGELLLELSGGLDSSIIAAALHAGQVPFSTLNFVTRTAEGDERRYALAVAEQKSERHLEIGEQEPRLDLTVPEKRRLRPGLSPVMGPLHRQFADHGLKAGAETFLTGAGGDNVFCLITSAAPVLDALRALGPVAAFGTVLPDVAEMGGCTIWTAARFALRKMARSLVGSTSWRRDSDFLLADAAPESPEPHPWLDGFPRASPGKREHVSALLRIQHVIDPETRVSGLSFLHPLLAQPLVELCLLVPTWLWVRGGRNRAVARHAFRDLLPEEVLARRSKGGLEGLCMRAYSLHRLEIAELLLGGLLREAGVIDPDPLESYLESTDPPRDARYYRIFELVTAELWLRSLRS